MSLKTGLCVPTLDAGEDWKVWLRALASQTMRPDVSLVIDSSSRDRTVELAERDRLDVHRIDKASFNHGATRQLAVNKMADVDIVIFLTQDAILASPDSIDHLLSVFEDLSVGAAYGRQLPRKKASHIEAHSRLFNYPDKSRTNSYEDSKQLGLKTAFISNSFAAYRVSTLKEVGGFPDDVIFGEDMYVATRLLKAGYKIAYTADASVYHSHSYSLSQEMRRYFDMGVFHAREPWIRQQLGGAEGEGLKFVFSEMKYLSKHAFWQMPEAALRIVVRYAGFRMGLLEENLPLWMKNMLAMNKRYYL